MSDQSPPSQHHGRIIRFRPRGASPSGWRWPLPRASGRDTPVADLSEYEQAQSEDDYRHRMTMNALALIVTVILIGIGIWLAVTIADLRKKQDCYLQGGRNCNQLMIPKTDF
jgi:hypothetical protein